MRGIVVLALIISCAVLAPAQSQMGASWDKLLQDAIPNAPADPALVVQQQPVLHGRADDFLNHFFFQARTEYTRQEISFTGNPTLSNVIDGSFGDFINPIGIPNQSIFQPNTNQISEFMNWGTKSWASSRVDTNFSVRYRQDLTHVDQGSAGQDILNTFPGNREIQLLGASARIHGLPGDGWFANSSVEIGRQYVYSTDVASFDGATVNFNQKSYSLTLFGGRRFTYYSDPQQRAIGGLNFLYRLTPDSNIEYDGMVYVKGTHQIVFRDRFRPDWLFNTYLKFLGGTPVEYSAQTLLTPGNGKSTIRLGFLQKLSDKDFNYDYTVAAKDLDPYNALQRLYLGPVPKYSQILVDARREVLPGIRVGGAIWWKHLNSAADQSVYENSFQDYRVDTQFFAPLRLEPSLELHQRNVDRATPLGATAFDDVSIAGETRVQDARLELRRTFGERGGLTLKGGGFYRRYNMQDRFYYIDNAAYHGFLGGAQIKLDDHTRLNLDYTIDNDFLIFRPDIQHGQVFILGLSWRY